MLYEVITFNSLCDIDAEVTMLGLKKYNEQIRIKPPATIVQNFSPLKVGLENKKFEYCSELIRLQSNYCSKYACDLGVGNELIDEYIKEHHKLVASDIIKYEEDLKRAKENCELEFRESFLARLKENIENAKLEFKYLNSSVITSYSIHYTKLYDRAPTYVRRCPRISASSRTPPNEMR